MTRAFSIEDDQSRSDAMLANLTLDRPMAVIDLETTGTDSQKDRIVEICVLKLGDGGDAVPKTMRLNPEMPIPPSATAIHKITDEDVADKPTFARIAKGLAAALEGCDLCGFNLIRYDLKVLIAEFKRVGVAFNPLGRRYVDPCVIFHQQEKRDLAAAVKFYCKRDHEGAHGAQADVLAAVDVLDAMMIAYQELPRTVDGLHNHFRDPSSVDFEGKFIRREDGLIAFTFGKHNGQLLDEVAATDPSFLRWMLTRDFMDDTKAMVIDALQRVGQPTLRTYTN